MPVFCPASTPSPEGLRGLSDAALLAAAQANVPGAYDEIVARYRSPLLRYCARITPGRAEDAVQQALLSGWLALRRGTPVRELRPWLYSIARNAAIDQTRATRHDGTELIVELGGGEDPAEAVARRHEVRDVLCALAGLPPRQRHALVATALHGREAEEVAGELGVSGGGVRQLVHRARAQVRTAVPSVSVPTWLIEVFAGAGSGRSGAIVGSGGGAMAAVAAKGLSVVAAAGALVAAPLASEHPPGTSPVASVSSAASARAAASDATTATDTGRVTASTDDLQGGISHTMGDAASRGAGLRAAARGAEERGGEPTRRDERPSMPTGAAAESGRAAATGVPRRRGPQPLAAADRDAPEPGRGEPEPLEAAEALETARAGADAPRVSDGDAPAPPGASGDRNAER